jgi:hypothetical protein
VRAKDAEHALVGIKAQEKAAKEAKAESRRARRVANMVRMDKAMAEDGDTDEDEDDMDES